MIAKLVSGNLDATVAVASPIRKPFDTTMSNCCWASWLRFGT